MLSRRQVMAGAAAMPALSAKARSLAPADPDPAIAQAVAAALAAQACPGAAVAVARAGAIIVSQGFGMANIETRSPVTATSIFRIGSLTKQFTAAAIIKLASLKRVDIHATATTYLPALAALAPFTLLELMNHTAGLHDDERGEAEAPSTGRAATQIELASAIARQSKPFDFDPGTAWLYSNANYIVLGAVIERVTHMPFGAAMSALLFKTLGLASLAVDRPGEIVANRVSGYSPVDDRDPPFANAAYLDVSQAGGAGAMRGNAVDLCRWHDALLAYKLVDRQHVELMLTPGRLRDGRLSGARRFSADDAHYGDVQYACGLLLSGPSDPNPSILHYGEINGFSAVLQTYIKTRTTFAVLCNGDNGPALPFRAVRKAVLARYL